MSRNMSDTQLLNFIQNYKVDIKLSDLEPHPVHANKFEIKFIASTGITTCMALNVRHALTDLYELVNGHLEEDPES